GARRPRAGRLGPTGGSRTAVSLGRAQFACQDGDYGTAEKIAREALKAEKAMVPLANLSLASALIGEKRWAEAEKALAAVELSPLIEGPALNLLKVALQGRVLGATNLAEARKLLGDGITQADTMGLVAIGLELRLRLAQVEAAHGDRAKGKALLADVAADARHAGL